MTLKVYSILEQDDSKTFNLMSYSAKMFILSLTIIIQANQKWHNTMVSGHVILAVYTVRYLGSVCFHLGA